jgi:hypothetical protein
MHLRPCYTKELADAFELDKGIVAYLALIYKDLYKV